MRQDKATVGNFACLAIIAAIICKNSAIRNFNLAAIECVKLNTGRCDWRRRFR
jgi:hypothetical protein